MALAGLLIQQKRFEEVEDINRQAHLACDAEFLPLLTAKQREFLSRWQEAEAIYLASFQEDTTNLTELRRIADFYLFWSKNDPSYVGQAIPYINRILRAANEGQAEASNPQVVWARQQAAKILYAAKDYQKSLKAERLLRQSTEGGSMNQQETELLADILIGRADPKAILQAKQLLSELREREQISLASALKLASLYNQTGEPDEAEAYLRKLLGANPKNATVRTTFISVLIDHEQFSSAERALRSFQQDQPKSSAVI